MGSTKLKLMPYDELIKRTGAARDEMNRLIEKSENSIIDSTKQVDKNHVKAADNYEALKKELKRRDGKSNVEYTPQFLGDLSEMLKGMLDMYNFPRQR